MRELYSTKYIEKYKNVKKRMEIRYVLVLIISILAIAGDLVYYALEPYETNLRVPLMLLLFAVTIFIISYSFVFFSLTYRRVRDYFSFLIFLVCGKRTVEKVTVLGVYGDVVDKSGVDSTRIEVLEWSDLANDYVERVIYVDTELEVTDIAEGDIITVATNGSYLLAYSKEN